MSAPLSLGVLSLGDWSDAACVQMLNSVPPGSGCLLEDEALLCTPVFVV